MNQTRIFVRHLGVAVKTLLIFTVLLGLIYPLAMTLSAQAAMPARANGSLLSQDGRVIGSALIGQNYTTKDGSADPLWFQGRPSAAGDQGYDAAASSGSNAGPENPELIQAIKERKRQVAAFNGVKESQVPADAVTASSSGLDPHISPAYARLQIARVAQARGLDVTVVRKLVEENIQGRDLGFLGEERVNVLELNRALLQAGKP